MTANGIDRTGVVGGSGGTRASFVDAFLDADTLLEAYDALGLAVNVKVYGAVGDGVTDDSVAVNLAAAALKAKIVLVSGSIQYSYPFFLYFPPGVYKLGSSINLQSILGYAWGVVGQGAVILGAMTGKTVFDCLGSALGTFRNLTIVGSATNKPAIGIQCGRIEVNANAGGGHTFDSIQMNGFFSTAGILNSAGEGNLWNNCSIHNQDATGNAYAIAIDGLHHIVPVTDFTASAWSADTADSCIQHKIVNCDLTVESGSPLFLSNCSQVAVDGYLVSFDNAAVIFRAGAGLNTFGDIQLTAHTETTGITNYLKVIANSAQQVSFKNFVLRDHNPGASDSLIKQSTNVSQLNITEGEIDHGQYVGNITSGTVVLGNGVRVQGRPTKLGARTITLLDDTATSFSMPGDLTSAIMILSAYEPTYSGLLYVRALGAGATAAAISAQANLNVTTGALAGTTGVDGKVTVSAHTDGKVYIENRSGGTNFFTYTLFGV